MPPPEPSFPPAFLQSLRTLFDILDDRRRGFVHLREIESRWQLHQPGGGGKGSPPGEALPSRLGVLEGLRRAAPPSGYLTFERFVLGLRAALLSPEKAGGLGPPPRSRAPPAEGGKGPAGVSSGAGEASGGASRSLEKVPDFQGKRAAVDACGTRKLAGPAQNEGTSKGEARRQARSRGEHRRHTITNGVDYGMLKQMKEMEKHKDFLLQGLEMVEQVREWYRQQIFLLQEQQKQLAQCRAHKEILAEGSQSHLRHLLPKLQDLNSCLGELLSLSAKPLSPCSTATNGPACVATVSPPQVGPQQTINMLKEQNWLLTKEVTDKSDRITQLEQEKSALIKQLFDARAQSNREASLLDSTFI